MKKTVLFINGHLDTGGCERSLVDVLKNFDYGNYEVDLLLLQHTGDYIDEIPKEVNVKLYSLDNSFGKIQECLITSFRNRDWFSFFFRIEYFLGKKVSNYFMSCMKRLFKDLKKDYDVIIAYRPGICTELAAYTFEGKYKISWWHHGIINLSEYEIKTLQKSYSRLDKVITVSESCKEMLAKKFPDAREKIFVIPNMIDGNELLDKSKRYVPTEFETEKLKIVSVGRMSPEKNMALCPEIGQSLKNRSIDFKWIIIGDGEEELRIKDKIKEYGLEESVILIGKKSNPYPYIMKADLMIHPSLVESQGISIIESMALHTPVIAVASSGPKAFLISGKNGYLVNPEPEEVVTIIQMLQKNSKMKMQIIENAYETAEMFKPSRVMNNLEKNLEA